MSAPRTGGSWSAPQRWAWRCRRGGSSSRRRSCPRWRTARGRTAGGVRGQGFLGGRGRSRGALGWGVRVWFVQSGTIFAARIAGASRDRAPSRAPAAQPGSPDERLARPPPRPRPRAPRRRRAAAAAPRLPRSPRDPRLHHHLQDAARPQPPAPPRVPHPGLPPAAGGGPAVCGRIPGNEVRGVVPRHRDRGRLGPDRPDARRAARAGGRRRRGRRVAGGVAHKVGARGMGQRSFPLVSPLLLRLESSAALVRCGASRSGRACARTRAAGRGRGLERADTPPLPLCGSLPPRPLAPQAARRVPAVQAAACAPCVHRGVPGGGGRIWGRGAGPVGALGRGAGPGGRRLSWRAALCGGRRFEWAAPVSSPPPKTKPANPKPQTPNPQSPKTSKPPKPQNRKPQTPPPQIKYIIDLVEVLALPSPVVRVCRKLKPWFGPPSSPWHAPLSGRALPSASAAAARAGVVPMGLLKQRVDISLTADTFWVHHDAQVGVVVPRGGVGSPGSGLSVWV